MHRKKNINFRYKFRSFSSYEDVKRFKKSSAVTALAQIRDTAIAIPRQQSVLRQLIVDNFDANPITSNGLLHHMRSIHGLPAAKSFSSSSFVSLMMV